MPADVSWAEGEPLVLPSAERLAADIRAPLHRVPGARRFTRADHPDVVAGVNTRVADTTGGRAAGGAG